jgi:hypothetical protein
MVRDTLIVFMSILHVSTLYDDNPFFPSSYENSFDELLLRQWEMTKRDESQNKWKQEHKKE